MSRTEEAPCRKSRARAILWVALCALVGGGALLMGCGASSATSPAAPRTIVWLVRANPAENRWAQEQLLPAWAREHPEIRIRLLIVAERDLAAARASLPAAGQPPHVWSAHWGGGFAEDRVRGHLVDLAPLIARDGFDTSIFIPEAFAAYRTNGQVWGLPFTTTGSYVFYNMKLFDAAGLPYPPTDWDDRSWTWDAMLSLAHKLTRNYTDPATVQYGWLANRQNLEGPALLFGRMPWPPDAYATGFAHEVALSDPATIAAYQQHHDLIHVDRVQPDASAQAALTQMGGAFQSGRVAMVQDGGWGWRLYIPLEPEGMGGFCWGVAPAPWGSPDAQRRVVLYTDLWGIGQGATGQALDDAWEFVKFLAREDNARSFLRATRLPPAQDKLLGEWVQQFACMRPEQALAVYRGAFQYGVESSNHLLVGWDELNRLWEEQLTAFFDDPQARAADVLPRLEEELTDALQRIAEEAGR